MLHRFFVMPKTIDRIRSSWIGESVEGYVAWMSERNFASRTVCRRVPILIRFGQFARDRGASTVEELPQHVDPFVARWVIERAERQSASRRKRVVKEIRGPIEQMLRIVLSDFAGHGRQRQPENPFHEQAPGFFDSLRTERGLRAASLRH
jgi:hypothetical protein